MNKTESSSPLLYTLPEAQYETRRVQKVKDSFFIAGCAVAAIIILAGIYVGIDKVGDACKGWKETSPNTWSDLTSYLSRMGEFPAVLGAGSAIFGMLYGAVMLIRWMRAKKEREPQFADDNYQPKAPDNSKWNWMAAIVTIVVLTAITAVVMTQVKDAADSTGTFFKNAYSDIGSNPDLLIPGFIGGGLLLLLGKWLLWVNRKEEVTLKASDPVETTRNAGPRRKAILITDKPPAPKDAIDAMDIDQAIASKLSDPNGVLKPHQPTQHVEWVDDNSPQKRSYNLIDSMNMSQPFSTPQSDSKPTVPPAPVSRSTKRDKLVIKKESDPNAQRNLEAQRMHLTTVRNGGAPAPFEGASW